MSDAEELCARAESIRDRVKLVMEGRIGSASDLKANSTEQLHSLPPKAEPNMDISRMIREEVTSVFQSEMGVMLDRQRELIQQVLKPPAGSTQAVEHIQGSPEGFHASPEGDNSRSSSFSPKPATTSPSHPGPYLNEDSVTEELRGKATKPLRQACGDSSGSIAQPMPSPQNPSGPNRRQKPSFVPNDETPLCPKCQVWLPDRGALEIHLDSCLQ